MPLRYYGCLRNRDAKRADVTGNIYKIGCKLYKVGDLSCTSIRWPSICATENHAIMSPRRDTSTDRWLQEGVYAGGYTIHDIRREPLVSLALSKGGLLERVEAMPEATVECLRAK